MTRCRNTQELTVIKGIVDENHYRMPENLKDKVVVDVGANVGAFSVYCGKRGALVYAIEPEPNNYKMLVEATNEWNVKRFNVAIGEGREGYLYTYSDRYDWASLDPGINGKPDGKCKVKMITFRNFVKQNDIKRINWLKLDCEGAERDIVGDIDSGLHEIINNIVGEFHYWDNHNTHGWCEQVETLKKYYPNVTKITDYEFIFRK